MIPFRIASKSITLLSLLISPSFQSEAIVSQMLNARLLFVMAEESEQSTSGPEPGPSQCNRSGLSNTGAAIYKTKFNPSWIQTYSFIHEVRNDPYKFLCTVCARQVACSHQGKHDVERHVGKTLHQANAKS